jgi:hypothetical protein
VICLQIPKTLQWKSYFSHLLNVYNVSDVRQIEIHTAEPLVPGPSHHQVETATEKLKSINLQAVIKFQQNCFKQKVIHKLINSIWDKEEFPAQ